MPAPYGVVPGPSSVVIIGFRNCSVTASIIGGDLVSFLIDAPTADLIALPIIIFHGDATQPHELLATHGLVGH
jgi:hypothetical protein